MTINYILSDRYLPIIHIIYVSMRPIWNLLWLYDSQLVMF